MDYIRIFFNYEWFLKDDILSKAAPNYYNLIASTAAPLNWENPQHIKLISNNGGLSAADIKFRYEHRPIGSRKEAK